MERVRIDEIELEYEVRGSGEPVVLIHAGVCADWFQPLMAERTLTDRFQLVRYHRVGYANSSRLAGSVSVAQQAEHCLSFMRRLGVETAHIVGHSNSANMALQMALDAPRTVRSLALLEPALYQVASAAGPARAFVAAALEQYCAGDKAGAVETFMRGVCGPDYRVALEKAIPGAFEQAVADADTFFGQELPALRDWSFSLELARRVTQPALAVIGEKSEEVSPIWRERHELLLSWLPNVDSFVLPNATHLLHVQNPGAMAKGLADFFSHHGAAASA